MDESLIIQKIIDLEKNIDKHSDLYLSVEEFETFVDSMKIKIEKKQLVIRQADISYISAIDLN